MIFQHRINKQLAIQLDSQ